jgi:hypothetical protein
LLLELLEAGKWVGMDGAVTRGNVIPGVTPEELELLLWYVPGLEDGGEKREYEGADPEDPWDVPDVLEGGV